MAGQASISKTPVHEHAAADPPGRPRPRTHAPGLLAGMRIRKKLIFLHTVFSLALAGMLLVALRPAVLAVVTTAEKSQARQLLVLLASASDETRTEQIAALDPQTSYVRIAAATEPGLDDATRSAAYASPGVPVEVPGSGTEPTMAVWLPGGGGGDGRFMLASVRSPQARAEVLQLYGLVTIALLAAYGLVALAVELLVLPRHVYAPIHLLLQADEAVRLGRDDQAIIPDDVIPADEMGEIMRSRNATILKLRVHERALGEAFERIERVAADLKKKNFLLEQAQRNLADADRLRSMGMMSAGIAHELNTPLAVLKGLVERLASDPARGVDEDEAALMARVVGRLERLGESLLDFARVRPPKSAPAALSPLIDEAITLVTIDRRASQLSIANLIEPGCCIVCDADRMVQVLVNLIRNAVDAMVDSTWTDPAIVVRAQRLSRDGSWWRSITITDQGQGLSPEAISTMFEPFTSSKLDAHGTGLGLAVAQGIIHEHGGVILARNRPDRSGAIFEILLPDDPPQADAQP